MKFAGKLKHKISNMTKGQKIISIVALSAIVLTISLGTLSGEKQKSRDIEAKIKASSLQNKDSSYDIRGSQDELNALGKIEIDRKENQLKKENPVYIETTRKTPDEERHFVNFEENKTTINVDTIPGLTIPRPTVKEEDVEEEDIATRTRAKKTANTDVQSDETGESLVADLTNLYAIYDSYNRVYGGFSSEASLSDTQINNLNKQFVEPTTTMITDFRIMPGSTFMGSLMTPINSNYPEMKVLIKFSTGDLKGWTGVGKGSLKSVGSGIVLTVDRVVSPKGEEYQVQGLAFNEKTGNPGFKDEVNNYLGQRLGYGILADIFNTAGSVVGTRIDDKYKPDVEGLNPNIPNIAGGLGGNGSKSEPQCAEYKNIGGSVVCVRWLQDGGIENIINERIIKNDKNIYQHSMGSEIAGRSMAAGAQRIGSVVGGTFNELANSYTTEVIVDPQSVLVIFY